MRRRVFGVAAFLLAVLVLVVGCGSGVSPTEQSQQKSVASVEAALRARGLTKVTLRIRHADGSVEEHCVWLADSELERQRGLMEVSDPTIGGAEAMVFSFEGESSVGFWMKDTPQPLSVAWISGSGEVLDTADMDPCPASSSSCPRYPAPRPYRLAIEMAQGRLQDWGIEPGATVMLAQAC
ncbi:MAG: DUF192 domain-containing protein [Actinomycetes bacterium]